MPLTDHVARIGLVGALWASAAAAQSPPAVAPTPSSYMDRVRDEVRARLPGMRACFERALRRDPTLTSRVDAIRFRVLPTGRVRVLDLRVVPRAPALERCMSEVLERMPLPPHPGAPIDVDYPINE